MNGKKIIRVFPRKTKATPDDHLVFFGQPTLFAEEEANEVHVSVAFTYDMPQAEKLAEQWNAIIPTKLGGPATGEKSGEFISGQYLKKGYTITSRGCPNKCWFCQVWRREGQKVRELPIIEGYNILDDNLLACSDQHIKKVFSMLERQSQPIEFTGGLEAKRLRDWHIEELLKLRLKQMFFAYDTPDDWEPLVDVSNRLREAGIIKPESHKARCFVLSGYPKDTMKKAEGRLRKVAQLGFMPLIMVYRDDTGRYKKGWREFRYAWSRPDMIAKAMNEK